MLWLSAENLSPSWAEAQTYQHQSIQVPGGRDGQLITELISSGSGQTGHILQPPLPLTVAVWLSSSQENGDGNDETTSQPALQKPPCLPITLPPWKAHIKV